MSAFDPTSVAHSLPPAPDGLWSLDKIAQMQAEAIEALVPTPAQATEAAESVRAARPTLASMRTTLLSGRYRSAGDTELELRIDLDGERPTRRVSGDFYRRTGGTVNHGGSFLVNTPTIMVAATEAIIEGEGVFSFQSASPKLRLTIPRVSPTAPRPSVSAQFMTSSGVPCATLTCHYESPFFRTVEFERDQVTDITPFDSYDTSRLPAPGRARVLTVAAAYAEAGIEFADSGGTNNVPIDLAGSDRIFSNSELHDAMTTHFSRWTNDPAWRVYILAATKHELGDNLRGIMFDSDKRQGCAVFHDVVGSGSGANDTTLRAMLRTYIHELGHCFNLYHSHQKELMSPPRPNRLDALSWMHYPDYYRGTGGSGAGAYWRAFPFQFDDEELIHLRHGFRNAVIPGGQPFGIGAADIDPDAFAEPIKDESGLALELRAPAQFLVGTPVVVEIKLSLTDLRGRTVNKQLHPNLGYVQIGIARVGGKTLVYRPMITHCSEPALVNLDRDHPSIYDSAYIGYGKDGFYFGAPGQYELRALYNAPDGSKVMSNILRIRIKPPLDRTEGDLADLFMGDEQGTLLYLLGSDSNHLKKGRDAFALAMDKYPDHTMTAYAKLVEGMNASKPFKSLQDGKISVRPTDFERSEKLLSEVVSGAMRATNDPTTVAAEAGTPQADVVPRLDNISLEMAASRLAEVRKEAGNASGAAEGARIIFDFFSAQGVPKHVQSEIRAQLSSYIPVWASESSTSPENADVGAASKKRGGGKKRAPKSSRPRQR